MLDDKSTELRRLQTNSATRRLDFSLTKPRFQELERSIQNQGVDKLEKAGKLNRSKRRQEVVKTIRNNQNWTFGITPTFRAESVQNENRLRCKRASEFYEDRAHS